MNKYNETDLLEKIEDLEAKLTKQKKITDALLKRVKKNLKFQLNTQEAFEHNSYLLNQIKQTKVKLLNEAEATQRYAYLSKHDSLTGLINRGEFNRVTKNYIDKAKSENNSHALFFLDLDQFKAVNDSAGHLAGDEMLKQIATVLNKLLTSDEILARLGGDEFGVLIKNCSKNQALKTATKILSEIDEFHFTWGNKLFTVSASIGVVILSNKTASYVEALKNADIACYAAKNAGRNRLHLYQINDDSLIQQNAELQWVPKLTKALEENQFCLYTQIIQSTDASKNHNHYEILIRLLDNGDIILPGVFLPTAERYNLITKIDAWIITRTFEWLSNNIKRFDKKTKFSINLSGQSLGDEMILGLIIKLLEKGQVQGSSLIFEVTETMAISNLQVANEFIDKIKNFGCGFSLDDFGSGLSSLSYLKNLNVDTLKVDGIFIRDILVDPIDQEMVRSINNIGQIMGMKTVAEYVENEKIAKMVTKMGFDFIQGNYINKPIPLDKL